MTEEDFSLKNHFDSEGNIKDPSEKEIPKPSPDFSFSDKEKLSAEEAFHQVTKFQEEFDLSKVGDIDFLLNIFAEAYDKYKSLPYLIKMRQKLLDRGYPETPILNEYLFWTTISRRLQIEYQVVHVRNVKMGRLEAEPLQMLKIMKSIAEQITYLQKSLNETLEKFEKISNVVDLHRETLDDIEKYIQENIGEFTFRCSCGAIVNSQGLPHWAIEKHDEPTGEKKYFIFSPELWFLYSKGLIPLAYIAFVLRTSVEGVLLTAKERNEKFLRFTGAGIVVEEEKSKQLFLEFSKQRKK